MQGLNTSLLFITSFIAIEGGGVNLCGVSFSLLLLWLWLFVLQWDCVKVESVDILALEVSSYGTFQGES